MLSSPSQTPCINPSVVGSDWSSSSSGARGGVLEKQVHKREEETEVGEEWKEHVF